MELHTPSCMQDCTNGAEPRQLVLVASSVGRRDVVRQERAHSLSDFLMQLLPRYDLDVL